MIHFVCRATQQKTDTENITMHINRYLALPGTTLLPTKQPFNTSTPVEAPADDDESPSTFASVDHNTSFKSTHNHHHDTTEPSLLNYRHNSTGIFSTLPPFSTNVNGSENHKQQVGNVVSALPTSNKITYLPATTPNSITITSTSYTPTNHHRNNIAKEKSNQENARQSTQQIVDAPMPQQQQQPQHLSTNDAIDYDSITFVDDSTSSLPNLAELSENFNSLQYDDMSGADKILQQQIGGEVFRFDESENQSLVNYSQTNDSIYFIDDPKGDLIEMSTTRHIDGLPSAAEDELLGYEGSGVGGDKIDPNVIKTLLG